MSGRILLVGATDLAAAVATQLSRRSITVGGIISAPQMFQISYRPSGMLNSRHVDMAALASNIGAKHRIYSDTEEIVDFARSIGADLLIAAGWHRIIPTKLRRQFDNPCLGLHASLLPRYRGGAPLNWTILNGDSVGGVSIFELTEGVDEGLIYGQQSFPVSNEDYISDLVAKSESAFLDLLDKIVPEILSGSCFPRPQSGSISYSLQRFPEDGHIDWTQSVEKCLRLIRAISRPYPGAYTVLGNKKVFIWRACEAEVEVYGLPGQIAAPKSFDFPAVVLTDGVVSILEAEFEDGTNALPLLMQSHNRRFEGCRL